MGAAQCSSFQLAVIGPHRARWRQVIPLASTNLQVAAYLQLLVQLLVINVYQFVWGQVKAAH